MQNTKCVGIFERAGLVTVVAEIKEDKYAVSKMIETSFSIYLYCS